MNAKVKKYDFPIKYFEENLFFAKETRACWAGYQVIGVNYDYLSAEKKINLLNGITRFVANIGSEAKILIIPVVQEVKEHYERIRKSISKDDPLYEVAMEHASGTELYLANQTELNGDTNEYNIFVFTKLPLQKNYSSLTESLIKAPIRSIEEFMGVNPAEIYQSELDAYKKVAELYEREQGNRLRLRKLTERDAQWLYRRMSMRGLSGEVFIRDGGKDIPWHPSAEPTLKNGEKAIRPYERDILTLTESTVYLKDRYLEIQNSDGRTSYQTFLTLSDIPDGIAFPGGEWLLLLQDYPIPTEVCIHIQNMDYREAEKKLDHKKTEIDSQVEHVAQNDTVPAELWEAQANVNKLQSELKPANDPLSKVGVSICVAADNYEEMKQNANFICDRYKDMMFGIERPLTDQYKLFMEFIPGAGRYEKDYILPLPPRTLAGSMFPAGRTLGDNEGHYIGVTGILAKKVFLNMARACRMNRSASAVILGTLGGGKSFLANLLLILHTLTGAKGLIIDPKGDRALWKEKLPAFADQITITTLSAGKEDQGKLDPFLLYRNKLDEACELAKEILCELYGLVSKDDEYIALAAALQRMGSIEKPCMMRLRDALYDTEDSDLRPAARRLAKRIDVTRNIGMSRLLFGEGDEEGLNFDSKINILQIQNISLPSRSTSRQDYTEKEIISTVLMIPIASFAKQFAMSDKNTFKLVVFDESWALNTTKVGAALFDFLARMGRSLNSGAIFIGHSVTDLKGEGIKEAITYKFCFRAKDRDEISRVLDFLDLEHTEENIRMIKDIDYGQCVFQDMEGHIGRLDVDAVWEDFIEAFKTTPGADSSEEGEAYEKEA